MLRSILIIFLGLSAMSITSAVTLEEYLADKIITDYDFDPDYVQVKLVRSDLDYEDLGQLEIDAYPVTYSDPRGRFPMRVELFRDGERVEKGSVSLDVRIFADLPVPVRNIKRHEMLSGDMFEFKRFDITSLTEKLLRDTLHFTDCRAKHNLAAGKYVFLRRVEKVPAVEIGHEVTIVGVGRMFEIRAKGVALQNGVIGEDVKVKNSDSRKILVGEVTAPGVVEISI